MSLVEHRLPTQNQRAKKLAVLRATQGRLRDVDGDESAAEAGEDETRQSGETVAAAARLVDAARRCRFCSNGLADNA